MNSPLERYLEPRQAQGRPPSDYENALADAIEEAFAEGIWDLPALVERLNRIGVRTPDGNAWTAARFEQEIGRFGA